jgi:hypothetical protein
MCCGSIRSLPSKQTAAKLRMPTRASRGRSRPRGQGQEVARFRNAFVGRRVSVAVARRRRIVPALWSKWPKPRSTPSAIRLASHGSGLTYSSTPTATSGVCPTQRAGTCPTRSAATSPDSSGTRRPHRHRQLVAGLRETSSDAPPAPTRHHRQLRLNRRPRIPQPTRPLDHIIRCCTEPADRAATETGGRVCASRRWSEGYRADLLQSAAHLRRRPPPTHANRHRILRQRIPGQNPATRPALTEIRPVDEADSGAQAFRAATHAAT